jgi:hypothetical protein
VGLGGNAKFWAGGGLGSIRGYVGLRCWIEIQGAGFGGRVVPRIGDVAANWAGSTRASSVRTGVFFAGQPPHMG